jgi:hypothetical protein
MHFACPACEAEELLVFDSACSEGPEGHVSFLCAHCGEQVWTLTITPASLAELQEDLDDEDERPRRRRQRN